MVLLFHAGEDWRDALSSPVARLIYRCTTIGYVGVDLFFVLSGFLITSILLASRGKPRYFGSFYARRALRIFPLYYLYLGLLAVVCTFNPAALRAYSQAWPWYALYLTNVKLVFFPGGDLGSVQHLWSLAIEEHFYLVWPAVVALLPPRKLLLFTSCAIALVLLGRALWLLHGAELYAIYHCTWTRADALLIGAAVAIARGHELAWRRLSKGAPALLWLTLLLCLGSLALSELPAATLYVHSAGYTLRALLFACVIVLCVDRDARGAVVPLLASRAARRLGALSYGIYIFHFFVVLRLSSRLRDAFGPGLLAFLASLASIALVSYCLADLSFRLLESPMLALKRYFPRPHATEGALSTEGRR
jgi:peptidoglycan/LPS O-acetylase OafA/YrhL